jgi:hypothetical protein
MVDPAIFVADEAAVGVGDFAAAMVAAEDDDDIVDVGVTGDKGLVGDVAALADFLEGISTSSPSPSSSSSESIPLTDAGTPKFLFIKNPAALPYPT